MCDVEDEQRRLPCQQKHDSPQYKPWTQKLFVKVPHNGVGKMETGYRFKYFDLEYLKPGAPYRDFLALSRNTADERGQPEDMRAVVEKGTNA